MIVAGGNHKNALPGPGYRAFLLRCWQEAGAGPDGEPAWRFALARPGGERTQRGFASLEALMAFLREELESDAPVHPACSGRARRDNPAR